MLKKAAMLMEINERKRLEYHNALTVHGAAGVVGHEKAADITPDINEL